MKIRQIAKICGDQDGAIWKDLLFRFNSKGNCGVYDMSRVDKNAEIPKELSAVATFRLDKAEEIVPHSNAVNFGCEYYLPDDEFPLLYSNIYNNYAAAENPLKGTCLVYRLERDGESFKTTLLQMITIDFAEDEIWKSTGEKKDIRPYGNFVIDRETGTYYGYTMKDGDNVTRYFSFDMPKVSDGEMDEKYGIKKIVIKKEDIKEYFDTDYHRFIQGGCCHEGKIYSVEGFTGDKVNFPALRVIDVKEKKQVEFLDFRTLGMEAEAEMIDFHNGDLLYSDVCGNLYILEMDGIK